MTQKEMAQNNNILYIVIIVLLVIIAILAFFIGKNMGNTWSWGNATPTATVSTGEGITVTFIDDERCTACQTESITSQIRQVPFLAQATFVEKDFSDDGVAEYLEENEITALPAVIFSTNTLWDGGTMAPYLTALPSSEYSLQVGATFDPFIERSEKGFLVLDKSVLDTIKTTGAYTKGDVNAKITWLEYSYIECPFCAKLHNAPTISEVFEKYGSDINMVFQHYPLDFHPNAKPAASVLECFWEQKWSEGFYALIDKAFSDSKSSETYMIDEAVALGADRDALESCVDSDKYSDKIDTHLQTGQNQFGVTGTPGNVLINNETGEYEVIPWAYGTETFVSTIDLLLK